VSACEQDPVEVGDGDARVGVAGYVLPIRGADPGLYGSDLLSVDSIRPATEQYRAMEDFYELLGVTEDAAADRIDRAWREQVHQYHPDVNDDARANAQFKTLQAAHEVLSDETERTAYDRMGHEAYVRERLDGLPTPADDSAGTDQDGRDGGGADGNAGAPGRGGAADGARTDRDDSRGREGGDRAGAAGADGRERPGGGETAGGPGASARTAATSPSGRRKRPRRPLGYGWAGIATAGVVYAFGLWSYLGVNTAALVALIRGPPTALPAELARAHDLVAPGTFALDAVAAGAVLPLAFVAGAVGLAVGVPVVVAWFGRGTAYLYAVGGVAPVAALAIGPIVAAPDGVVLAGSIVIPVTTVTLLLVDIGRELRAGP
jgi:curved DNA-binding protein CbpA